MNKFKLFVENFLVYGMGGIISKIIPLIMVPIVTRIMPNTDYYGISDLSNTIVQFGSALALMGMYDAMYRMFFEREDKEYKIKVCSTSLVFTLITSVIVFLIMVLFQEEIARFFFSNKQYAYVVYLSAMATLVGATNSIISAPTRMQNKRKVFLIANTVSPLISYGLAIPMLLAGYYVIALPLAAVISGATMELMFWKLNKEWFKIKKIDSQLLKQLLILAIPLLPNFLIYWVFNSCDRIMITNMIGIGAAGIYAVGSKLGHASQLIYTAFAGGWQYFAFSTMRDNNQIETNSIIYELLGLISFITTALVCAVSFVVFKVLFTEEYLSAYIIAPYLFMAPLLQMLYQTGNNQFLVIKKSWPGMFILSSGAVVNVFANLMLIPILGIEGASIATLLGYIVTCVLDIIILTKCNLMRVSIRFLWVSLLMMLYMVLWRLFFSDSIIIGVVSWGLFTYISMWLYGHELKKIIYYFKNGIMNRTMKGRV